MVGDEVKTPNNLFQQGYKLEGVIMCTNFFFTSVPHVKQFLHRPEILNLHLSIENEHFLSEIRQAGASCPLNQ